MTTSLSRFCCVCALVLGLSAPLAAQIHISTIRPAFKPDPNARVKTIVQLFTPNSLLPGLSAHVFTGTTFPALDPWLASFATITYYDASFRPVKTANVPGPYGAVVDFVVKDVPKQRRFVTLYRTAHEIKPDRKFSRAQFADLAKATGLTPAVVERQAEFLEKRLRARPFRDWAKDSAAARALAGLYFSKGGAAPVRKYDDADALERQWWVSLKRRLYGWDKKFSKVFVCPQPIKGKALPVVRPGTLVEAGFKPGSAEKIDAVLQAFARDTDQAFAVCIVRRGVIVLHKAYGERDGKAMTVDTKSWMASITKTMAATCMLMLIDQGLVGFDDALDKFFPPLEGIKVKKPLTIHHLYTHTNGLTLDGWPGWNDAQPDVVERIAAYYDRLRVGQQWAYTGTGNIVGSKIIEAVTGEALPQFYHKHLLTPLGCTHTDVTDSHAGAVSTALDMAKFGQLLLNRGAYGKQRFFRPETFAKMLPGKLDKLLGPGARSFGFGLDGNAKKFGHGAASSATFSVDTERELVVIMTRNRFGKNQDKYNGKFWEAINEGIVK